MELPPATNVTVAPRCPRCQTCDTIARRSQRIADGVEHAGVLCTAQKQYRQCRACGKTFAVIKIGSPVMRSDSPPRNWIGK